MGKTIRGCRKGKNSIFRSHTRLRKGPVKMRKMDFAEKEGYVKGVVKAIIHESGRGAPLAKVQFQNAYRYQRDNELMVAPEGLHEGMFIYCGAKAQLAVGNILPISAIPEGTVICNAEARLGDRGAFARCSGDYAVVVRRRAEVSSDAPSRCRGGGVAAPPRVPRGDSVGAGDLAAERRRTFRARAALGLSASRAAAPPRPRPAKDRASLEGWRIDPAPPSGDARRGEGHVEAPPPVGRQEDRQVQVPRHDWHRRGRRPDGQTDAQGGPRVPQVPPAARIFLR